MIPHIFFDLLILIRAAFELKATKPFCRSISPQQCATACEESAVAPLPILRRHEPTRSGLSPTAFAMEALYREILEPRRALRGRPVRELIAAEAARGRTRRISRRRRR